MATKEKVTARFLEKDGKVVLQADSAKALSEGWKEPTGQRANGAPWNPEPEEGIATQADVLAQYAADNAEGQAKRDAAKAKKAPAVAVSDPTEVPEPKPDFRVAIVEEKAPAKPAAKKAAKRR